MTRMHELDENERAVLDLLIQDAPMPLSLEELGAELGETFAAEDALGGLLRRNLVRHTNETYWTASRPATYLAKLDHGLPRYLLDLLPDAAPASLSLKEVATESGEHLGRVTGPLDQLERRSAIHRDAEDASGRHSPAAASTSSSASAPSTPPTPTDDLTPPACGSSLRPSIAKLTC